MNELEKLIAEAEEITKIEKKRAIEYTGLSYNEKWVRKKGFANYIEYLNQLAQLNGFTNYTEYENWRAQQKGFNNSADYHQKLRFKNSIGTGLSMSESRSSAPYLGIFIAERLLPNIFENPKMMLHGNIGYDAICKNNYKIDVKSSTLNKSNFWSFHISKNKIADAFLCIAFDSRENLYVKYVWLIPGNEVIRKRKLNELKALTIHNTDYSKKAVARYELTDKTDEANNTCALFMSGVLR